MFTDLWGFLRTIWGSFRKEATSVCYDSEVLCVSNKVCWYDFLENRKVQILVEIIILCETNYNT